MTIATRSGLTVGQVSQWEERYRRSPTLRQGSKHYGGTLLDPGHAISTVGMGQPQVRQYIRLYSEAEVSQ